MPEQESQVWKQNITKYPCMIGCATLYARDVSVCMYVSVRYTICMKMLKFINFKSCFWCSLNSNLEGRRRWWWFRACLDVSGSLRFSRIPFSHSNWHLSCIYHFIPHFPIFTLFVRFRQIEAMCILSDRPINLSELSAAWQNLIKAWASKGVSFA